MFNSAKFLFKHSFNWGKMELKISKRKRKKNMLQNLKLDT